MRAPSRYEIWYGRDEPPGERRVLRAGPLTAQLDGGDLRYIRIGNIELVRRIYVAVRDLNWNTLPADLTDINVDNDGEGFTVRFDCRNRQNGIDFAWRGTIVGSADGTIRYTMDGAAQSDFRYAKIGICIHHPIREDAGRPFSGQTPDGAVAGALPRLIGPQVHLDDGTDRPLFDPVDRLEIDLGDGMAVRFAFEGNLFEMEDQRNWTDASFKTASTPAYLGYVHAAQAGQAIRQSVTIGVTGACVPGTVTPVAASPRDPHVTIGEPLGRTIPPIGLGMASHGGDFSPREIDLLRHLAPAHLRVDLHLGALDYQHELRRAIAACRALDCGLELAVFLSDDVESAGAALDGLAVALTSAAMPVERVLVFRDGEEVAAGRWVRLARERLRNAVPGALFVGGTNVYFNELNRNRPEIADMDAVVYSINPQIHAFDEASLTEALEGQAETVISARAFSGDRPIVVSPITLKPRFNAVASVPESERAPDELPDEVDRRQMSLFGAAWTVGSVKQLAESGAGALTYYETTGWRGVMETEAGSPPSAPFPSQPGMVFPLYHVLADLAGWRGGQVLDCQSSDPLTITALAVRTDSLHVLLANMTPSSQRVTLDGLGTGRAAVRRLNEETAPIAMSDPDRFRSMTAMMDVSGGGAAVEVAPFEVVRLDL